MRILILALSVCILCLPTAHAQELPEDLQNATDVPAPVPAPERMKNEKAAEFKEKLRGAQDQFLQHQDQVKARTDAFKKDAALRVETIKTKSLQRREQVAEKVSGRRALVGATLEERQALIRTHMEERKAMLVEKRARFASTTAERKEKLDEKLTEKAADRYDHAMQLMNAMLLRLSGIADRIDARIDVLAGAGVDVSAAETALSDARSGITTAETAVAVLAESIAEALISETPRESLQATRSLAEEAKAAIRAAHESLRAAVKALPRVEAGA